MTLETDEPTLIGGNGDLNGSPSPSTLSPADWSATGGRRRKSRGKKRKGGNGMKKSVVSRYEAAAGETKGGRGSRRKKGKSRTSKSNRKK
jgi:hypothetical protein